MKAAEWKDFALDEALARELLAALDGVTGKAAVWEDEVPMAARRRGTGEAAWAQAGREASAWEQARGMRSGVSPWQEAARAGRGAPESAWTGAEVRRSMSAESAIVDGGVQGVQASAASAAGGAQSDARLLSRCFERDARRYG